MLPAGLLLNHDDYFAQMSEYRDPHAADIERLKRLHRRAFDQWTFELEEGFNLCFYGYGSKRKIAMEFAEFLYYHHHHQEEPPKIIVANAYTPGFTVRDILTSLANAALPRTTKLPAQPGPMLDAILSALSARPPSSPNLYLIIHSLDHANLRKGTTSQSQLARLAAHPAIALLATCDTLNFPLMWDVTLSKQLRFLHHDATTFEPYAAELDVVEDVNLLLGRSSRRLGGKDGVGYVLKSLPENARSLFRILVAEQLALADSGGGGGDDDDHLGGGGGDDDSDAEDLLGMSDSDEAAAEQQATPSRRGRGRPARPKPKKPARRPAAPRPAPSTFGIEYRTLYHKAVEEFVCSSEVNFRTLLKEFHDHQMVESRRDGLGTERLSIPFRREELEGILEELV
jgi:origin recognition complex subunit 2